MRIRIRDLKRFIFESIIREGGTESEPTEQGDDSLDSQVDRYFAQYENEAKSSKTEGLDMRALMRRLLGEAGDDDGADDGGDAEADAGLDALGTDEPAAMGAPEKLKLDSIDVDSFANGVVRLINNYDSLLEVKSALARRAMNFIGKTYDPEVVEALKASLRDDHGIIPGKSGDEVEDELYVAPAADRAGDGGSGGGGPMGGP